MRVKLTAQITGTRNGVPWPDRGEEVDLPDEEATTMVAIGMAEAVEGKSKPKPEPEPEPEPKRATRPLVPTRTLKGKGR